MIPLYLSFLSPTDHTTVQGPNWACRALPMAELPLLPWAPPLARVVPKTHLCPQLSGRAEDPAPECSRLLVVPSIHITPSSDGESSPCTPPPRRLQLLRIPDLESPPQDRSDWVLGWKRGYFSLGTHAQGWGTEGQSVAGGQLAPQELGCKLGNSSTKTGHWEYVLGQQTLSSAEQYLIRVGVDTPFNTPHVLQTVGHDLSRGHEPNVELCDQHFSQIEIG